MIEDRITLNENQKKAIKHKEGPLLVVAGAGTGKTRVITERIKHLVEKQNVKANEILALTFTDKAAKEMLERIGDVMPLGYEEPWVYTFHAFSDRILRTEGLEIGLDPSYKILSYPDQWLLLRKNIFKLKLEYFRPRGNPTKFISAILKFISRLQDENVSTEEFKKFAEEFPGEINEKKRWLELSYIYNEYQKIKVAASKMDFGDLITWAIKLFGERPNILKKYQKQFKHILVDEFQDTNYAQYELIKLLYPKNAKSRSLLVVGDDSQSIYKFRGAAVSNILQFKKDYLNAQMISLLENYRSTQKILDPAYKLIKNNNPDTLETKLGISKELISTVNFDGPKPEIVQAKTLEDEVGFVISKIYEVLAIEPSYTYKDFAVLARANNHLDPFVMALRQHGLPYQLVGNRGLYDRDEIRDVISLLRILINPKDNINLYRALNIETLSIPYEEISQLLSETKYKKIDLWDALKTSRDEKVLYFTDTVKKFQEKITKLTPVEFVYDLVTSIRYLEQFTEEETVENQLCIKNLDLFLNRIKKFETDFYDEMKEIATISDLVNYLDLMIEAGENPAQAEIEDIDTINLLTVHASKGLEFPVVFIINMVSDRFPVRDRKDPIQIPDELIKETLPSGNEHIQEERRLFYVGMTRSEKYLFVTLAKNYGGRKDRIPSGFLHETELNIKIIEKGEENKKQAGLFGVTSGYRRQTKINLEGYTPKSLSYSKIETYKTCPLKYKYQHVLNIPTPPSPALSFGNTIHQTLYEYHQKLIYGQEVALKELLKIYEKNWQPVGYLDKDHRNLRFEDGKKLLEKYYEDNKDKKIKHVALEGWVKNKIGGILFTGKVDRIDKLPRGGVEIIDYKTGETKTQKEVDTDSQVTFYTIGVKDSMKLDPKKLTYYFLESGEKISTTRTKEQIEDTKKEVTEIIKEMKKGTFEPKSGMHCNWCDYKEICPFAYKG